MNNFQNKKRMADTTDLGKLLLIFNYLNKMIQSIKRMYRNIIIFIIGKVTEKENPKAAGLDDDDVWGDVEDVCFL